MGFVDENAGPAHLPHLFPERAGETFFRPFVAEFPERRDRRFFVKKPLSGFFQHFLFFGEDQRHVTSYASGNSRMRFEMMLSCTSEVPPSIEFALVRSQPLASLPSSVRSPSHSSASEPDASMNSS